MRIPVTLAAAVLILGWGALANAQTKFTLASQCAKADPEQAAPVNDQPGHVLAVSKTKCTLSGGEINGLAAKEQEVTAYADVRGARSRAQGYVVVTVQNGDKAFVSFDGTGNQPQGQSGTGEGKWRFTGGTGKLKGLKGSGTYKSTNNADGTSADQIEGDWAIAAAPAKK